MEVLIFLIDKKYNFCILLDRQNLYPGNSQVIFRKLSHQIKQPLKTALITALKCLYLEQMTEAFCLPYGFTLTK